MFASLWPVADTSTSALMRRFYTLYRDGGTTKLAALRHLIAGTIKSEPSDVRGPRPLAADDTPDPDATARLIVLGLAERHGKGVRPTNAGWVVLGDRGRPFQN